MDFQPDEELLIHGLKAQKPDGEAPLHIRRTLDQSYFLSLKDTSERDRDQVVYRETKLAWQEPGDITRVVMVDQLWLWILDERLCTPTHGS